MTMTLQTMNDIAKDFASLAEYVNRTTEEYSRKYQQSTSQEGKAVVFANWKQSLEEHRDYINQLLEDADSFANEVEDNAEIERETQEAKERAKAHGGITFDELEEHFIMHNADGGGTQTAVIVFIQKTASTSLSHWRQEASAFPRNARHSIR